jgi:hypothetical protein
LIKAEDKSRIRVWVFYVNHVLTYLRSDRQSETEPQTDKLVLQLLGVRSLGYLYSWVSIYTTEMTLISFVAIDLIMLGEEHS